MPTGHYGTGVKVSDKRNKNNFIKVNGFIKKGKKPIFDIGKFVLTILKIFAKENWLYVIIRVYHH